MRVLITAGPTREPIDAVRYIGNRSSGRMGAALAEAAVNAGHQVTLILGPVSAAFANGLRRIDIETSGQMHEAVLVEFPAHDLLIMAAAVADYRPKAVHAGKTPRQESLTIECEATADILAGAGQIKRPDQRTVGFSLELAGNIGRAREKLLRKKLDLIVYNTTETMNSESIEPSLLWPDGRVESLARLPKARFAEALMARATELF
ncbi:MAG TPA: phosphopantothenoylcysteine decarboxylase [Tepidisphaeraceae bacterium]|jgi:phosphopantothenoylcysteine decarboxylase/phosphopantothenate--cysteine ligase|nr:phosphopantothenoylcysteine decarboxylase [Tepidisphaeraceae bacterium]